MNENLRKDLTNIAAFIKKNFGAEKVIIFGSHAYGNPTEESDIDLLVVMNTQEKFAMEAAKIRIAIDHMLPNKSIDIIVRSPDIITKRIEENDFFLKDIMTKGISL